MKANRTVTITGEANIFVIPNTPVIPVKDISFQPMHEGDAIPQSGRIEAFKKMAHMNGRKYWDEHDPLVELWFHDEESQNFVDHGVTIDLDGTKYDMRIDTGSYIPASFLKDLREGKSITLNLPVTLYNRTDRDHGIKIHCVWEATLTANQSESRYRNFGTFEKVLSRCLASTRRLYAGTPDHNFKA